MIGIDKIKDALLPCINFGEAIADRLEDGKISTWEYITLAPKIIPIIQELKNGKEIIAQFKDIDEAEAIELTEFFKAELDIPDDKLEEAIENGWGILMSILTYILSRNA